MALKALGAKGGAEQTTRVVAPVAAGGQRAGGRTGQGARRVAGRRDPPGRRAWPRARCSGTETVVTTLSRSRPGGDGRGADPRRLPVHRLPQRQDRTQGAGLRKITALSHGEGRQGGGRARGGDRRRRSPPPATSSTPRPATCSPPNSPSGQRLWARRPDSRSRSSTRRRSPRTGYGGVVGVGKGSSRPPRLVRLTHRVGGAERRRPRRSRWSARASPSTPAASRSSRPPTCTT